MLRVKVTKDGQEIASIVLDKDTAFRVAEFLRKLGHDVSIAIK